MRRRSGESWDLLNIGATFTCYPRTLRFAQQHAKIRNAPIMIRHFGSRPDMTDPHRVNHWVIPNGTRQWKTADGAIITSTSGQWLIDVDP
jgi:hypothetical protein